MSDLIFLCAFLFFYWAVMLDFRCVYSYFINSKNLQKFCRQFKTIYSGQNQINILVHSGISLMLIPGMLAGNLMLSHLCEWYDQCGFHVEQRLLFIPVRPTSPKFRTGKKLWTIFYERVRCSWQGSWWQQRFKFHTRLLYPHPNRVQSLVEGGPEGNVWDKCHHINK